MNFQRNRPPPPCPNYSKVPLPPPPLSAKSSNASYETQYEDFSNSVPVQDHRRDKAAEYLAINSPNEASPLSSLVEQKLDSIHRMVCNLDQRLKNHFQPPHIPPRDDKLSNSRENLKVPGSNLAKSNSFSGNISNKGLTMLQTSPGFCKSAVPLPPPPRPHKALEVVRGAIRVDEDGSKTFTAQQCLCMTLQLTAIRDFIDSNFDDEDPETSKVGACLDSALRMLSDC